MSDFQPRPNPARWQDASIGTPSDVGGHIEHGPALGPGQMPFGHALPEPVGRPVCIARWDVDGQAVLLTEQQQPGQESTLGILVIGRNR